MFNSSITCFAFFRRVSISSIEEHVELVVGTSQIGKLETGCIVEIKCSATIRKPVAM